MTVASLPETDGVEYREIEGYPGYIAGNDGSVWSSRRGRWKRLRHKVRRDGYEEVTLYDGTGYSKQRFVHQCVLEAFVGPCPDGMEACHFPDNCRANNRIDNLRWGTSRDNKRDMAIHGTQVHGERHHSAKLTSEKVAAIRQEHASGATGDSLAIKYAVSRYTISQALTGSTWKRVGGPIHRPRHYLTDEQVREIRSRSETEQVARLAAEFGVCVRQIYRIIKRRSQRQIA